MRLVQNEKVSISLFDGNNTKFRIERCYSKNEKEELQEKSRNMGIPRSYLYFGLGCIEVCGLDNFRKLFPKVEVVYHPRMQLLEKDLKEIEDFLLEKCKRSGTRRSKPIVYPFATSDNVSENKIKINKQWIKNAIKTRVESTISNIPGNTPREEIFKIVNDCADSIGIAISYHSEYFLNYYGTSQDDYIFQVSSPMFQPLDGLEELKKKYFVKFVDDEFIEKELIKRFWDNRHCPNGGYNDDYIHDGIIMDNWRNFDKRPNGLFEGAGIEYCRIKFASFVGERSDGSKGHITLTKNANIQGLLARIQ